MINVELTIVGWFRVDDGYGSMTEYMARGLVREGYSVNIIPLGMNVHGLALDIQHMLADSSTQPRGPILYHSPVHKPLERFLGHPNLFISTMYESDTIPPWWRDAINQARAAIVPSRFNRTTFRNEGIDVPIEVVPDGVDPEVYHYEPRPDRPLTTLMVGMPEPRKNMAVGVAAWQVAFEGDRDVRLIIKSRNKIFNVRPSDSRIDYVDTNEMTRGIAGWYRQADILMALGNEGFGLPLVEGMATGLPVIALDSEGQSDTCQDAVGLLLPVKPSRFSSCSNMVGLRGVPNPTDVARHLRWITEHRDEARDMGRTASEWVTKHRNVWTKGPAMGAVVDRYAD